jgi:hypothetical protein
MSEIDKFLEWAREGRRSVKIELDNLRGDDATPAAPTVWCFDYEVLHGKYVKLEDGPPTTESLRNSRIEYYRRGLAEAERIREQAI